MPRKNPGPPCIICGKPSQARSLCNTHYSRWSDHGDPTKTLRPADWGRRTNHPLNGLWAGTKRVKEGRVARWDDLYAFAEDVGDRPGPEYRLRRLNVRKPWGPDNFEWKAVLGGRTYTLATREGKAEYARAWRAANPLKAKANSLSRYFGMTIAEYDALMEKQGGVCAICRGVETHGTFTHLAVDHCHQTNQVRGLLCNQCNRALGGFRDDPERLRRAIEYLGGAPVS